MILQELSSFSADELRKMQLSQSEIDKIPIGKRLKVIADYSQPVRFGPDLWHILCISKNYALIMASTPLEKVEHDSISKKLSLFLENNFSLEERENLWAHYDGTRELVCLNKYEVEKYLDSQEKTVGRHWWVLSDEDSVYQYECINEQGAPDYTNHYPALCLRPVAKIAIPDDLSDVQWNQMWENSSFTELNLKGYWKSVIDSRPETETLHRFYSQPESQQKTEETWVLMPRIDVSDM